jgi:hypothetical protein
MKIASISVALLATLSVAIWTSHASARQPAGWPAAAAKCRAQVRAQYLTGSSRSDAYRACLADLGCLP